MDTYLINERYTIIESLNSNHGIFLGKDTYSGKKVVIKILSVYCWDVYLSLKNNPIDNIPQIFELYKQDNKLTVVQQYIEGDNLQQLSDNNHVFNRKVVCEISIQICDVLKQLHQRKIIHRDIKPSNIIIDNYNKVWLIDFNASKFEDNQKSMDTVLLGTVGYASPEQYGFAVSTTVSDIYSIGILMNVLLTGKFPNEMICSKPLAKIVQKCTEMDPDRRYQSVDELIMDLRIANKEFLPFLKSFTPVGFRSGKIWKMIISSLVTFLYIGGCLISNFVGVDGILTWIYRILLMLIFLINVGFVFDYHDVRKQFGLDKLKLAANIVVNIVFFGSSLILLIFIASVAENILK